MVPPRQEVLKVDSDIFVFIGSLCTTMFFSVRTLKTVFVNFYFGICWLMAWRTNANVLNFHTPSLMSRDCSTFLNEKLHFCPLITWPFIAKLRFSWYIERFSWYWMANNQMTLVCLSTFASYLALPMKRLRFFFLTWPLQPFIMITALLSTG